MEQQLIDWATELIKKELTLADFLVILVFALPVLLLFRANIVYDFVDKFKKREMSELRDLLADENVSETAKEKLREKIDLIAYERVTGIKTDKYLQKKITNCYELAGGRLRYSDFKRAFNFNFLKTDENGNLEIRKTKIFEWILIIVATVASAASFLGFLFLLYVLIFAAMPMQNKIIILLLTIVGLFFSFIYLFPLSSVVAANRIEKEIKIHKSKNKQLRPYGLCKGEFTVPNDFDKEKELGASLSNLSSQQLNSVHQFINTLEIPETNEDIDRVVEHYRQQNKLLPIGLAKEKFTVPDDFDDPLPDEILDLFEPK